MASMLRKTSYALSVLIIRMSFGREKCVTFIFGMVMMLFIGRPPKSQTYIRAH